MLIRIIAVLVVIFGCVLFVGAAIGTAQLGNSIVLEDIGPVCQPLIAIAVGCIAWKMAKP